MSDDLHTLQQTVSDNVQKVQGESKRTQRMAAGAGVSQKTVSNLASMGRKKPKKGATLGTLAGYSNQLGLPAYQLLIKNLPETSEQRKKLDRLIRTFVGATPRQQDWILETLDLMGHTGPTDNK